MIPLPPGGAFDAVGRPLAEKSKAVLGALVIENIDGGGSSIGAAAVARAKPDGYSILPGATQTATAELEFPKMTVRGSIGLLASAGTPQPIIERIAQATRTAVADRGYLQMLTAAGMEAPSSRIPSSFAAHSPPTSRSGLPLSKRSASGSAEARNRWHLFRCRHTTTS